MKFLEVFNQIEKGNFALTDEAIYASLQNGDELIPLYGGNKDNRSTERMISISAKTKKGIPINVFSGEGIIISLDGSAGSMIYKNGERFALNHHAGFISLRTDASKKVDLEYFSRFMQKFYKELSVSDGSKTLSLTQIYSEEFDLPDISQQKRILKKLKNVEKKIDCLKTQKNNYKMLLDMEQMIRYINYQAKDVRVCDCLDYMSGNSGLTEELIYQNLQNESERYQVLSSATEKDSLMGEIPFCTINNHKLKVFTNKKGLLVTRKGKAGHTKYLREGKYAINDDAYILYVKERCPYQIDLRWLAIQYRQKFLEFSSNADNGTWNMTGFFKYTQVDIPDYNEQLELVKKYELIYNRIDRIERLEKCYFNLLSKEIS